MLERCCPEFITQDLISLRLRLREWHRSALGILFYVGFVCNEPGWRFIAMVRGTRTTSILNLSCKL